MYKHVFQVLIVDSNPVLREVLVDYLGTCEELNPIGSAATGRDGIRMCRELTVDIVLTEFHLPDMDGLEAIRQMRKHCPISPIVVLATTLDTTLADRAIEAGATGWLEKGMSPDLLVKALLEAGYKSLAYKN